MTVCEPSSFFILETVKEPRFIAIVKKLPKYWLVMEIKLEIPEYHREYGIKYTWEPNFDIEVKYENNTVLLIANAAGLRSLANHFLNLAQQEVPTGSHLHFDECNSLEKGSIELIIEKK